MLLYFKIFIIIKINKNKKQCKKIEVSGMEQRKQILAFQLKPKLKDQPLPFTNVFIKMERKRGAYISCLVKMGGGEGHY